MSLLERKHRVLALLQEELLAILQEELLAMRSERLRESSLSGGHRMDFVACGASNSRARADGPTFVERLERSEAEDAQDENADEVHERRGTLNRTCDRPGLRKCSTERIWRV